MTETASPALVKRERRAEDTRTASGRRSFGATRVGDGVAWRGAASRPQAGSGQEHRGGEEEPAHGVQVGIPHTVLYFDDREDETASDGVN